jgi:hypothetical protein
MTAVGYRRPRCHPTSNGPPGPDMLSGADRIDDRWRSLRWVQETGITPTAESVDVVSCLVAHASADLSVGGMEVMLNPWLARVTSCPPAHAAASSPFGAVEAEYCVEGCLLRRSRSSEGVRFRRWATDVLVYHARSTSAHYVGDDSLGDQSLNPRCPSSARRVSCQTR